MRVLVVGSQGQVAQELARQLPAAGHEFLALGRPDLDLAQPESIVRAVSNYAPDAIINAAAYTAVDRAEDEPAIADAINGHGVGVLGRAASGVPVIHYSTDYVFDGTKPAPYAETDPTSPIGAYGASKLLGEQKLLAANPRSVVLRTSWVCSPHGNNFVKTMLRLGRERDDVSVVADQQGAPTFADDLAQAAISLLPKLIASKSGDPAFGVFHFSGAPDTNWHDFAFLIFARAALHGQRPPNLHAITSDKYPTKAKRPTNSRLDCSKILKIHGLARPDWRDGLTRTLDQLMEITP
jgi:dTDP-4-dehydrorhamnose reductase